MKQVVKKPVAKAAAVPAKAAKKAESSSDDSSRYNCIRDYILFCLAASACLCLHSLECSRADIACVVLQSSSEDEAPAKPAKKTPASPVKKPAAAPASPAKKPTPAPKVAPKKAESSDSDSSSEEEKPAAKAAPAKANGKAAAAVKPVPMDSDDSDSSSEEEKPAAKAAPAKANGAAAKRKADSSSDSDSSSEDEAPAKKAKAETPAAEKRKQAPAAANGQKAKKLKVDTEDNGEVAPMDDDAPAVPQTPSKSENGDAGNNKVRPSALKLSVRVAYPLLSSLHFLHRSSPAVSPTRPPRKRLSRSSLIAAPSRSCPCPCGPIRASSRVWLS